MAGVPIKAEYGPTLGHLLAPRWRRSPRGVRAAVLVALVLVVAALVGAGLTLENATYSRGSPVPFSFSYRDLYRVTPDPGGYVKVQSRYPDGSLRYSYAVDPLRLPPYSGSVTGELPMYAVGYIRSLARHTLGFELRAEGKTMLNNTLSGYQVAYESNVEGRPMYTRSILLVPPGTAVRDGVIVVVMASPRASSHVDSPREIAESGELLRPVKTFAFG